MDVLAIVTLINLAMLIAMALGIFYMRRLAFRIHDDLDEWRRELNAEPDGLEAFAGRVERIPHEGKVT